MKKDIIAELSKFINKKEKTRSSHWEKYQSNFLYNDGVLSGLEGFGTNNKPLKGLVKIIYEMLLKRYTKHKIDVDSFKEIKMAALEITEKQNRALDLDVIRQCLTIDFLRSKVDLDDKKNIIVIGDGWGILTSLLLKLNLAKRVILINLNKTLLVDLSYIKKVMPEILRESILVEKKEEISKIKNEKLVAIRADNYELLKFLKKDLVININSFQEMNINIVNNYIKYLENDKNAFLLYHCNRLEKILPDGSKTKISDFKFNSKKEEIVNEICPWQKDFITKIPPFIRKFDGEIIHQLISLNQ